DDAQWRKISPNLSAKNFNTPTLIVHGALDYRVPDSQGFELFNILQNKGVKSRLLHFPNENHWVLKPQNSLFWYETTLSWLREHIGEEPGVNAASQTAPGP